MNRSSQGVKGLLQLTAPSAFWDIRRRPDGYTASRTVRILRPIRRRGNGTSSLCPRTLQSYFTNRIAQYLATKNRTAIVWNETVDRLQIGDVFRPYGRFHADDQFRTNAGVAYRIAFVTHLDRNVYENFLGRLNAYYRYLGANGLRPAPLKRAFPKRFTAWRAVGNNLIFRHNGVSLRACSSERAFDTFIIAHSIYISD